VHFVGLFFVFIIENARSKKQKTKSVIEPSALTLNVKASTWVSDISRHILDGLPVIRFGCS